MRRSLVGALLIAGLVIAATAGRSSSEPAFGLRSEFAANSSSAAELITHVTGTDAGPQTLTVIDPRQRVVAVYHVDRSTGAIALKSVRNFTWDLQMIEFNSGEPLPQDIRAAGPNAVGRGRHMNIVTDQPVP